MSFTIQGRSNRLYSIMTLASIAIVFLTPIAARKPLPSPTKYAQVFKVKKKRKKRLRKTMRVFHTVLTLGTISTAVILTYLKYQATKALANSQDQVDLLTQRQDQLQERRNASEQQQNQLQQQVNQLQRQLNQLQLQEQNNPENPNNLFAFDLNIDQNQTENFDHQENIRARHATTGCTGHNFKRYLHSSQETNQDPITGEIIDAYHFIRFACSVCNKIIPVCYLADGIAFYRCANHEAHIAAGTFGVCRSCAVGKEDQPCRRCGADHVKIFSYEKEDLCLACTGYDKRLSALTEILTTAGLAPPELQNVFPDPSEEPNRTVSEAIVVEYKDKRLDDPYLIEEVTYKINRYNERYVHPISLLTPLTNEELAHELEGSSHNDMHEYESIMDLLNSSDEEVDIMTIPLCRTYSWHNSVNSISHIPESRQKLKLFFVKPHEENPTEAYLILQDTFNPIGVQQQCNMM